MRTALALVAALALSAPASSHPITSSPLHLLIEQDQTRSTPPTLSPIPLLSVSAESHISVAPDLATVRLGVFAQEKEAASAQNKVNEVMAKIVTAVRGQGVAADQIQTAGLTLTPVYTTPAPRPGSEPQEPRITAYHADSTVTVRVKDLKRTGATIDAALAAGANQLQGVTFGLQDETQARIKALQQAAASAKSKASAMAQALEVRLLELMEANEGGADVIRPVFLGRMQMDAPALISATPVEAGQVEISASVTLRYRIAPVEH